MPLPVFFRLRGLTALPVLLALLTTPVVLSAQNRAQDRAQAPPPPSPAAATGVERSDDAGGAPESAQRATATARPERAGLQTLDWVIIAVYVLSTIGLGIYFSRQQGSTSEYFVGGGNMNPVLIGVSLFATLLSTITYLSIPGEAAGKGPVMLVGLLVMPLIYLAVSRWLLPVYMKQRVTSAYELLEERLGLSVRLLGVSMFLALRLVWMTLLVFMAAKAMTVMLAVDYWEIAFRGGLSVQAMRFSDTAAAQLVGMVSWEGGVLRVGAVQAIVLLTGTVSVIYTTLGGLRAVVITDFMQTVLLFGGAVLVIAVISWQLGGLSWFPTSWQENWDTQPFFSLDPQQGRVTVVGTLLSIFLWYVATMGGDQTSVQRFMATSSARQASRAVATQLTVGVIVQVTLYLVGFALMGYFLTHPDQLPDGAGGQPPGDAVRAQADRLFPQFIAFHLPVGVSGLVVSAMFAAAMSSIDSGVNSITAVVSTDLLDRFGWQPKTERGHLRMSQVVALLIGGAVVVGSTYIGFISGNITAATNKTVNLLTTPIFGLFFFAIFVPRIRPAAVWVGAICGVIVAVGIAFSGHWVWLLHSRFGVDPASFGVSLVEHVEAASGQKWTTAQDPVSFQWIAPLALAADLLATFAANGLLSLLGRLLGQPARRTE